MKKVIVSWSSGKDSAWMLFQLLQDPQIEVVGLCCSINSEARRVAMHGVQIDLLQKQAAALKLPLDLIELPFPCSNEDYLEIMSDYIASLKDKNIDAMAFGDLFLADVKAYREEMFKNTGIEAIFPVWDSNTKTLPKQLFDAGFQTMITCVDTTKLPRTLIGSLYDQAFIDALPEGVDPCGENGEFHSFVFAAPMFNNPIEVIKGEEVERAGFLYIDLIAQ